MTIKKVLYALMTLVVALALLEGGLRLADRFWRVAEGVKIAEPQPVADRAGPYEPLPAEPEPCDEPVIVRPAGLSLQEIGRDPEGPARRLEPGDQAAKGAVFVLGGSTAFGDGVEYEATFAAQLAKRLAGGPRVINAGRNGADSAAVLATAKRLIDCHAPAALVVVSGNNEWLNWRHDSRPSFAARLHRELAASVLYRYAVAGVRGVQRRQRLAAVDRGEGRFDPTRGCRAKAMEATPASFSPEDWRKQRRDYLTAFAFNITQLLAYAKAHEVPVVLGTVPFRRQLCPGYFTPQPMTFLPADNPAYAPFVAAYEQGLALRAADKPAAALAAFEQAIALDSRAPLARYFAGEAALTAKREAATAHFRQGREQTVGNLGAMLSINYLLQNVPHGERVAVVDTDFALVRAARGELEVDRFFHDFCHPTAQGHDRMAAALYPALAGLLSR
jgi:lysophospholipase L1-like esterase